jgi:tetratricopeptide (TPR) repeat protein
MNFMKRPSNANRNGASSTAATKRLIARAMSSRIAKSPLAKGFLATAVVAGVAGISYQAAWAQAILQQQGTLAPMEDAYSFEGVADQVMTIELESEEFDTLLTLKGPDGEVLTSNDDYGGTLNSTIVIKLPESGSYSAIASSFSGSGGKYQIEVRPATEYEQVFSRAYELSAAENYEGAIAAYTEAIALNDTDPGAYLGRAQARISNFYLAAETGSASPDELPQEVTDLVVADFLKAADLLEQQGQTDAATSLRDQANYFSGGMEGEMTDDMPMPVEPDGGNGATPGAPAQ